MDFISEMDIRDQPRHQSGKERLGRMSAASQELAKWKKADFPLPASVPSALSHLLNTVLGIFPGYHILQ